MHRHLNHEAYTPAAIEDVIARGKRPHWAALRRAALADRAVLQAVLKVAQARAQDPSAQRFHFWKRYAERRLA